MGLQWLLGGWFAAQARDRRCELPRPYRAPFPDDSLCFLVFPFPAGQPYITRPPCVSGSGTRASGCLHKAPEGVVAHRPSSGEGPSLRPTDTMAPVQGSGVATEAPSPGSEDAASGWRWSQKEASTIWSVVTTEAAKAWQPKGTDWVFLTWAPDSFRCAWD